jgi:hypothetical protein
MDYLKKQAINQLIPDSAELKDEFEKDRGYVQAIACCDKVRKANKMGFSCTTCDGLSKKYRGLLQERGYSVVEKGDTYTVSWMSLLKE